MNKSSSYKLHADRPTLHTYTLYTLYRKVNVGDGDHEPCNRLMTSNDMKKIFTIENYEELKKYERKHYYEDYEESDEDNDVFFYFIHVVKINKINKNGEDLCNLMFNPQKFLQWTPFKGSLNDFKKFSIFLKNH